MAASPWPRPLPCPPPSPPPSPARSGPRPRSEAPRSWEGHPNAADPGRCPRVFRPAAPLQLPACWAFSRRPTCPARGAGAIAARSTRRGHPSLESASARGETEAAWSRASTGERRGLLHAWDPGVLRSKSPTSGTRIRIHEAPTPARAPRSSLPGRGSASHSPASGVWFCFKNGTILYGLLGTCPLCVGDIYLRECSK